MSDPIKILGAVCLDGFIYTLELVVDTDGIARARVVKRDTITLASLHASLAIQCMKDTVCLRASAQFLLVQDSHQVSLIDRDSLLVTKVMPKGTDAFVCITDCGTLLCSPDGDLTINGEPVALHNLRIGETIADLLSTDNQHACILTSLGRYYLFKGSELVSTSELFEGKSTVGCCCLCKKAEKLTKINRAHFAGKLLMVETNIVPVSAFHWNGVTFQNLKFPANQLLPPIVKVFAEDESFFISFGSGQNAQAKRVGENLEISSFGKIGVLACAPGGNICVIADDGNLKYLEIPSTPAIILPSGAKIEASKSGGILYSKNSSTIQLAAALTPVFEISRSGDFLKTDGIPPIVPIWPEFSGERILKSSKLLARLPTDDAGIFSPELFEFVASSKCPATLRVPKFVFKLGKSIGKPGDAIDFILADFEPGNFKVSREKIEKLLPLIETQEELEYLLNSGNKGKLSAFLNSFFRNVGKADSVDLEISSRIFEGEAVIGNDFESFVKQSVFEKNLNEPGKATPKAPPAAHAKATPAAPAPQSPVRARPVRAPTALPTSAAAQEPESPPALHALPVVLDGDSAEILWRKGREFLNEKDDARALACFLEGVKITKSVDNSMFRKFARYACLSRGFAAARAADDSSSIFGILVRLEVEDEEGSLVAKFAVDSALRARRLRTAKCFARYLVDEYQRRGFLNPEEILRYNLIAEKEVHASPRANSLRCPGCHLILENPLDKTCTRCGCVIYICMQSFRLITVESLNICRACGTGWGEGKCPICG